MKPETKTEPNLKQAVPFFGVSNIEDSVRYYVDSLGFEMTNRWVDDGKLRWCWFERGGAALKLMFQSYTDTPEETEFSEDEG